MMALTFAVACAAQSPTAPPEQPVLVPQVRQLDVRQLDVIAEPTDAADFLLNPKPVGTGGYVPGITVTIDVLPKEGWEVKDWVGPVHDSTGNAAKITMDSSQTVVVRLVPVSTQVDNSKEGPAPQLTRPVRVLPGSAITPTPRPPSRVQAALDAISTQTSLNDAAVFRGHSYSIVTNRMSWTEANRYAESLGGHLVTLADEQESLFVSGFARIRGENWLGIGLTDEANEGHFVWVTGEPLTYTNWGPGEPSNAGPGYINEDYVSMTVDRKSLWNDVPEFTGAYIIEFDGLTTAVSAPTPTAIPRRVSPTRKPRPVRTVAATPTPTPVTPVVSQIRRFRLTVNGVLLQADDNSVNLPYGTIKVLPPPGEDGAYSLNTVVTLNMISNRASSWVWKGVDAQRAGTATVQMFADKFVEVRVGTAGR